MSSQNRLNVLLPGGIGAAGKFKHIIDSDPHRFVRSEPKEGSLSGGFLLLRMTAQELLKVHNIVGELQRDYPDGFPDLEWQYSFLTVEMEALQHKRKNTSAWNFIKRNQIRQTAEELYKAGDELYNTVKAVSNNAAKELLAFRIANAGVKEVEAAGIAENEQVMGFSLDQPLDPKTASTLTKVSYHTALEEPYTGTISLGDADGHKPSAGDLPLSGGVSSAEHKMPASSCVCAARADNHAPPARDVPDSGARSQNSASSSVSPVNISGDQRTPPGGNIPDSGSPGVQNVTSASPPAVPNISTNSLAHRVAEFGAIWPYIAEVALSSSSRPYVHVGDINIFKDSIHSPNSTNPSQMKGGSNNAGPINGLPQTSHGPPPNLAPP